MYWTRWPGDIMVAQMDGTGAVQLVTGRDHPVGITVDYETARLYWTEYHAHRVCSSNLDGTDVKWTQQTGKYPWGIALLNKEVYVGYVRGDQKSQQLTTNRWNFNTSRENHCAGQYCAKICVLTTSAFSCVR